ncbi:hypothetical protein RB653_000754 [Dictyostelium firmibasis]|uniref:Uncharacterized protein n=1 Tax=Dictyostelium firmibasis TaxID=79012 RepID=A0AAN7Z1E8_9MYCE
MDGQNLPPPPTGVNQLKKLPAKPISPLPMKKLGGNNGLPPPPANIQNGQLPPPPPNNIQNGQLPPPPTNIQTTQLPPPPIINQLPPPPIINQFPPPPLPNNTSSSSSPSPSLPGGPPPVVPRQTSIPPQHQQPQPVAKPMAKLPPTPNMKPPPASSGSLPTTPIMKPPPVNSSGGSIPISSLPQLPINSNSSNSSNSTMPTGPPPLGPKHSPMNTSGSSLTAPPPLTVPPPPLTAPPAPLTVPPSTPMARQNVLGATPPPPLSIPPTPTPSQQQQQQTPLSPNASTRQAHLSSTHNRTSSQDSNPSTVPQNNNNSFRNSTDAVCLASLDQPEIYPQTRIAEENFNYLKDIHTKINKRSQSSQVCSREGSSLAETFKNYGTMLISQSDNVMGQCMFKVGDFQKEYEEIRDQLDIQSMSGLKGTIDQFINRDIKVVRTSRKNFDKMKSMYESIDGKVNSNANKGKGVNLVKQAELQQERDFLRGRLNQVGQESLSTIKLANESNSVEIMEQMVEYMENMQQAVKALSAQMNQLQVPITTYKKEAIRRRAELDKSIEAQKNLNSQKNGQKDKLFMDELDREVAGEDLRKTRLRRFLSAERQYLSGLNTLVTIYLAGLRTDDRLFSKIFKEDEIAIFSNIEPLYSCQSKFVEELESCYKGWGEANTPTLGGVFFKNSQKMMQLYSVYITNFSKALLTISRCKQSKNFQAFLKTCEEKSDGADLDSLIPLPLTRVGNYLLLLTDMKDQINQQIQNGNAGQADQTELKHVTGAIEKVQAISECVKQSQNLIHLSKLQQSLTGFDSSLLEEGRFLVKEGTLSMGGLLQPGQSLQQQYQYYFILLTDILLYCKKQTALFPIDFGDATRGMLSGTAAQQSSNTGGNKYKFIGKFDLKNMDVKNITDMDQSNTNSFQILCSGGVTCTLFCDTKQQKEEWFATITKTISKCNQNKLFGIPLEAIMQRPFEQGRPIPSFLQRVCDYLYDNAPPEEGIFRLSANQKTLDMAREEIETGVDLDYNEMDIHAVAGILKLWVRNLPEPLLTYKYFDTFVDIADLETKEEKIAMIKNIVEKLPADNKFSTFYLMKLLAKVSENSTINKMTPNNISIVFATLLLRKKDASPLDCTSFNSIFGVIECFMTGFSTIFFDIEKQYYDACSDQNKDKRKSVIPNKPLPIRPPVGAPSPLGGSSGGGSNESSPSSSMKNSGSSSYLSSNDGYYSGNSSVEWTKQTFNEESDSDDEEGFSIGSKQASITIQLGEIVKQGYLTKKGAMRRNWTKRWFVLKQGYLFYFKTSKDKKPKGIIQLTNVVVSRSYYKPNCMAVRSSTDKEDREFLICANSQADLEDWIKSISNCITQQ